MFMVSDPIELLVDRRIAAPVPVVCLRCLREETPATVEEVRIENIREPCTTMCPPSADQQMMSTLLDSRDSLLAEYSVEQEQPATPDDDVNELLEEIGRLSDLERLFAEMDAPSCTYPIQPHLPPEILRDVEGLLTEYNTVLDGSHTRWNATLDIFNDLL